MPLTPGSHDVLELLSSVEGLLDAVGALSFPFETPEDSPRGHMRDMLVDQYSTYVTSRLRALDSPLLVVVGGSTGVGKSTLVNSIVGRAVTRSGVLRPTTRTPVLACHPDDLAYTAQSRLLPDIARTQSDEHYALRIETVPALPKGIMVLDAPDIDSVDAENRQLADRLFNAADVWLFTVSAARYADQMPWNHLAEAAERDACVAVVLDRAGEERLEPVRRHLARMMTTRGLSDAPLFTVREVALNDSGVLPFEEVGQIVLWLQDLASDPDATQALIGRALAGAIRHGVFRSRDLADAVDEQLEISDGLRERAQMVFELYAKAMLELVGRPGADLVALAIDHAERAASEAVQAWNDDPHGRRFIDAHPELGQDVAVVRAQASGFVPGEQLRTKVLGAFAEQAATFTAVLPDAEAMRESQERVRVAANRTDTARLAVEFTPAAVADRSAEDDQL